MLPNITIKRSVFMRLTLIILVATCFLLMNCSSRINNNKKVFYYNESSGIATLDPAFAKNQSIMWAIHQIYSTLVEIDTGLHIVPSIAKNWQVSADRLTYTFNIRQGIYFHDNEAFENGKGRALTAHDIVYSFNRIQEKKTASSGAWIFNNRVDSIHPFIALNDSTFQLHLLKPFQPILGILSTQYCSIVPKEVVEKFGKDFRRHPCGTGPFQFQSWDEGQALILHKNEQYFEQDGSGKRLPYLDAIKVSFFDNKATEFLQFQQGNLSFINDIDPSFKDEVITKNGMLRKEWDGKVLLKKQPYLNTEYLGILVDTSNPIVKNSPLKLKAIRQAMNFAINKQQLMLYMRNSIGIPAEAGFVPRGLPSHNAELVKGYTFNPTKAKQLLINAGFSKQKQLPVIKLLTIAIYSDIASFIAKQLEEIGFNIQVEVVQKSLLLEQTAKSQAGFFRGSWIADYPDAENYMAMFYSKNPAPPNYTRYKNPAFDLLYEKALVTINDEERYELYRQMDQMVINDAPVIPIWYDMAFHLTQTNLINFEPNALNLLELRRTNYK